MTEDPIAFQGGDVNLNRFVGNAPTTSVDPAGLFEIDEGARNITGGGSINPAVRGEDRNIGSPFKFVFGAGDQALFVQKVSNWGGLSLVDECGLTHDVRWQEEYLEAWVNGTRSRRAVGNFVTDNHFAGPTRPAAYLEQVGKFKFKEDVPNKKLYIEFGKGERRQVLEWTFYMEATFTVVNGDYRGFVYRVPVNPTFFGRSRNKFEITNVTINSKSMPRQPNKLLDHFLWPAKDGVLGAFLPDDFPPQAVSGQPVTSTDKWHISWRQGEAARTGRYIGQYK
jgi:hypothetical protein